MSSKYSRFARRMIILMAYSAVGASVSSCGSKNGVEGDTGTGGSGPSSGAAFGGNAGDGSYVVVGVGGTEANLGGGDAATVTSWPPSSNYTNVTDVTYGAYALGPALVNGTVPANAATTCSGLLFGVVRDFKMGNQTGGHPDFETAPDSTMQGGVQGIVAATLGADDKPVYASPTDPLAGTHSQADFDQWYHDAPGVNMTYIVALRLTTSNGVSTFSASINNGGGLPDSSFFPLDNAGFGNEGYPHNFSFTTEIHTSFTYNGGEVFTFKGDDDVWVFINKQLVIDLGGRHSQLTGSVQLDSLGLMKGTVYDLAIFNAERHTVQSNFRVDTTLAYANCGVVNGVVVN